MLTSTQLLVLDPEKRISIVEIEQHPWIVKHCKTNTSNGERASVGKSRSSAERES